MTKKWTLLSPSELESQIESLRETQRKYSNILRLARALTSHFYHVVQTQVGGGGGGGGGVCFSFCCL